MPTWLLLFICICLIPSFIAWIVRIHRTGWSLRYILFDDDGR